MAASDTAVIGRLVDGVILVVQPDKNRRRLVLRAAEGFAVLKIVLLGVVINRVGTEKDGGYYGCGSGYGYQYGYGDRADHDQQEPEGKGDLPKVTYPLHADDPDPPAKIVPRRVA